MAGVLALGGVPALGGCSTGGTAGTDPADTVGPASAGTDSAEASFLFVQQAGSAVFEPRGEVRRLVLSDLDAQTLLFSDRPARDARVWPTQRFVDRWVGAFGNDPPNAVVVAGDSAGGNVAVELSDPEYSASQQTLTYTAELLDVQGISADLRRMSGGAASATEFPSEAMADVSVFIDDSSAAASPDRTVTISEDGVTQASFTDALAPALQSMAAAQTAVVGVEVDYEYGRGVQVPVLLTHARLLSGGGQQGVDPQSLAEEVATEALDWLATEQPSSGEFVVSLTER